MIDSKLYTAREGVKLVCHVVGEGPLIAVLPSIGRGSGEMHVFASALAGHGFRVALIDPRGVGASEGSPDFDLRDLADDVAGILDQVGRGPAVVVGHAFGNWVARMAASRHPDKICGVVLAAAGSGNWPRSLATDVERCCDARLPREDRLASLRKAFFAPGNDPTPWLEGWHPDVLERQKRCVVGIAEEEWWSAGRVPILDLQAASDPFRPEGSRSEIADALPGRVECVTIDWASHALPFERPLECASVIAGWIGSRQPHGASIAAELIKS